MVPAVITLLSNTSLTEQRHLSIFQVSVLINHVFFISLSDQIFLLKRADVWGYQGFFSKWRCPDIKNWLLDCPHSEWTVMQCNGGFALRVVTQATEEKRGRMEKYVRTWWVGVVTHYLFLLTGGRRREVCSWLFVANHLSTLVQRSPHCANALVNAVVDWGGRLQRNVKAPCSPHRCWCYWTQVHMHGYTWFHDHSSIRCSSWFCWSAWTNHRGQFTTRIQPNPLL